ncbi:unnamed protein product [Cuscuta europaea]|uniref:YTH domain-containing family protein n=1 Tax=Cuscuta europaea TaxID=41803 RepID=A0A9P0Z3Y9_CUSEU|nr:unnamed protein product [Cuscuta europaea]
MSSDTAKENASVVDSSVTEWRNDKRKMDNPAYPNYREKDDHYRSDSEADYHANSCEQIGISAEVGNRRRRLYSTRYFIIKSLTHDNFQLSVNKGIWATQVMNEPILEEAFHNSRKVILIFSVNMSGFFQGYAQMMSSVGQKRDRVWGQGSDGRNPWGRTFNVKWLRLHDLPFQKTLHLKNPWNQYKPVKISRDCQELHPDVGKALCELLDGKDVSDVNIKVDNFYWGDHSVKMPHVEHSVHSRDGICNMPLMHMGPMMYSSLTYQHHTNMFHAEHHDSDSESPLASILTTLTDDDIIDMTYEEYLEAHSKGSGNKTIRNHVSGQTGSTQQSSISKENCDESQSGCSSKKSCQRHSNS